MGNEFETELITQNYPDLLDRIREVEPISWFFADN